jgi:hypothetical protein
MVSSGPGKKAESIARGLRSAGIPGALVDELLDAFIEAKRRFYRADLRPNAVEGGRFSEAVFRILQYQTTGGPTPLGKKLPSVDALLKSLENSLGSDSVRLHIPRTLRVIYDIRNKRDAAHLGDGISPNIQDASLIVASMSWVLAELVREYHDVGPDAAHRLIDDLVSKDVPVVQEFGDHPRVLKSLKAGDYVLVLLYWRGAQGASPQELSDWVRQAMRRNLARTLTTLDAKDLVHVREKRCYLTRLGEAEVERRKLVEPG